MFKEDDIKSKIFNTIHMNKTKRKYFRIEKNKLPYSKDNKSKAIFKTKKEYNFLNRKTHREEDNQKLKNNKFVTTTIDDTTASVLSENSFVVQNIIPKKLVVKEKKELKNLNNLPCFSKMEENILFLNNENKSKNESKNIDEFLYQIYQDLQILNRKIYIFKFYESVKDNSQLNQEDFKDIINLKNNLLLMKNLLKNNMSQNLVNIYMNIDNFCKVYSS